MVKPRFSIIIPTYNAARTLKASLESIINQSFKDFEIVIVDGESSDNTLQVLHECQLQNTLILSEKDNGVYDAMNKGIKIANGEWLYFMGSDDTFFNKSVLESLNSHTNDEYDIIYGNSVWVPENLIEAGEWNHSRFLQQNINHQRIFYRAGLFGKFGLFNTKYQIASDNELNIRFFCSPHIKKKYVDFNIANYHSGGLSANKTDENFWNDWKNIIQKNFSPYLPQKDIYGRLSGFCFYNISQKKYFKASGLFFTIFFHTFSLRFVKATLIHTINSIRIKTNYSKHN